MTNLLTIPDYACSQAKMSHTIERCEEQFHKMPNMQQNPEDKWTSDLVKIMFHSILTLFKEATAVLWFHFEVLIDTF